MNDNLFKILKVIPTICNISVCVYFYKFSNSLLLSFVLSIVMSLCSLFLIMKILHLDDEFHHILTPSDLENFAKIVQKNYGYVLPYLIGMYFLFFMIVDIWGRL